MASRGLFIAFEGIDGCGKSTQARRVATAHDALWTFEPGDTPLGANLRQWLLNRVTTPMTSVTEALLMLSDRSHHVATVIAPELARPRHVVSDRFAASTLAYQGYGRGLDLTALAAATELAIGDCRPDRYVLIDLDVNVAHDRRARSADDRFESADVAFHQRVRDGYLAMAAADPTRWVVIDGHGTFDEVGALIDQALAELPW